MGNSGNLSFFAVYGEWAECNTFITESSGSFGLFSRRDNSWSLDREKDVMVQSYTKRFVFIHITAYELHTTAE